MSVGIGIFGIFFAIVFITVLAYKGFSTIWVAPIAAAIVTILGGLNLLDMYKTTFMQGFAGFVQSWFPAFMLGAIFGKLMECTKMAQSVALGISRLFGPKRAIIAAVVAGSILTYGGVSMFVAVFGLYPICLVLFRQADIPRRLIPATITVGVFEYTMVCLPGSPQIQNLIPCEYFGTTPMAAPVLGLLCGLVMGGGGLLYVMWRAKKLKEAGEHFTEPENTPEEDPNEKLPNVWISLIPLVLVVVTLNVLKWDLIQSMLIACVFILVVNIRKFNPATFVTAINDGAKGAMMPIISVGSINGFGAAVKAVPAFAALVEIVTNVPGSPLISLAVAANVLCGATGSASGGLTITLSTLAERYIMIAQQTGIPVEVMHRIVAIAAGMMDTVPHNGAILTLLAVCGMTHKDSYPDIAVCTIGMPMLSLIFGIILASLGVMF